MKNLFLGSLLCGIIALGAACDRWEPGEPVACMSLEEGTIIEVGETFRIVSCAQNAETTVWRVNLVEVGRGDVLEMTFDEPGEMQIQQEVIGYEEGTVDRVSEVLYVGYPSINKISLLDLDDSDFKDSTGDFRLTLYATNYDHFWDKEVSGSYEGEGSLPFEWEVKNPRAFSLRDSTWKLHAEWFWEDDLSPLAVDVDFDASKATGEGYYLVPIPAVGTFRFDTEIAAPL